MGATFLILLCTVMISAMGCDRRATVAAVAVTAVTVTVTVTWKLPFVDFLKGIHGLSLLVPWMRRLNPASSAFGLFRLLLLWLFGLGKIEDLSNGSSIARVRSIGLHGTGRRMSLHRKRW